MRTLALFVVQIRPPPPAPPIRTLEPSSPSRVQGRRAPTIIVDSSAGGVELSAGPAGTVHD